MSLLGQLHDKFVFERRINILASRIAELLPKGSNVLDIGCGDGQIDQLIMQKKTGLSISGTDVLVRQKTHIPVTPFDGNRLPFDDNSFDAVTFVDVLHHTGDPRILLREARRVSKDLIVIKDHLKKGLLDYLTLKLMDYVGNAYHGVVLPYNYLTEDQWKDAFESLGLTVEAWRDSIGLYPWPATFIFDRSLHFIAKIRIR